MGSTRRGDGRLSAQTREQLAHVRTCEKSGETLKSYAERNGLRVQSLYHAKRQARKHGVLPPDRRRRDASPVLRGSQPPRFVEAIRRMDAREGNAAWRIRFPGGVVLESTVPLSLDETLRLIEKLEGRA